ncbi:kinase-like domain-containing protein [Rhizophagus clarus]|nr:kinase-like domain-containing protein [Rhizophagus clarus]
MSDNTEYHKTDNKYFRLSNKQQLTLNSHAQNGNNSSLYEELSQIHQKFFKVVIREIEPTTHQSINENILEEDLSIIVDELIELIFMNFNKGKEERVRKQQVLDYINNYNINLQEIYNWLLRNQTSSNFIYLLGHLNYYGIGIVINKKNAFKLYQKAAELENDVSQFELANMYIDGDGCDEDYDKAFELSKKLAKKEYPCGLNLLGYCYEHGIGTEFSEQKAFELYEKVAELKNLSGICNLGICYENGIGTEIDEEKAFELYQVAADLGYSYGINNLGCCYSYGIGTDFDDEKAFELYQKAANLENEHAQFNLAIMYEHGKGVEKNIKQAVYWLKKCADQGHQGALNELMDFYSDDDLLSE